jgi:hypothetical protein
MAHDTLDFTSKRIDLVVERDTTLNFTVTYQDTDGNAFDLNHYTSKMQVKSRFGGQETVLELSSETGSGSRLIHNDEVGEIRVFVLDNDTLSIPKGDYIYDLVIYQGEDVRRLMAGKFILNDAVTDTP